MNNLMNAIGMELFWEQPEGLRRNFVLCAGENIYAKLDFPSALSTLAEVTVGEDRWAFERKGFLATRVTICRLNSDDVIADYRPKWTGTQGSIRFFTGGIYRWSVANFWATRYILSSEDGHELITYHSDSRKKRFSDIFKQQARVIIGPEVWQLKALPMLLSFGWYLVILYSEDSTVVATTASIG